MHKTVRTVPMDGYLIGGQKVLQGVCFGASWDPIHQNLQNSPINKDKSKVISGSCLNFGEI